MHTTGLLELLPEGVLPILIEMPVQAREFYSENLPRPVMLHREYQKWVLKWKEFKLDANLPEKLIGVFKQCDAMS